jgi:predicted TIM-barrel fold metal-dependent hydrolase
MGPFFALAVEYDLPVLVHSGGLAGPSRKFQIAQGHTEIFQEVLMRHPGLRLYLENAGFPFLEETVALLYRYPGVYVDVSTITWIVPRPMFHRYLRGLIDAGLSKRIMFGSDQMEWPETIGLAIEAIESAEFLTADQRRDIFYNNAARFLRLERSGQ